MTAYFKVDAEIPLMSTTFIEFLQEYPLQYEGFDTYLMALMHKINSPHGQVVHLPIMAEHLQNYQKIAQYAQKIMLNTAYYSIVLSQAVENFLPTISLRANIQIDFMYDGDADRVTADRIGNLTCLEGNVVRVNMNVPQIARAVYRCNQCNELQEPKFVFLDDFRTVYCQSCHSNDLQLVPELCAVDEQQKVRLQTSEQQINCVLFGPNAKQLHAGDPVKLLGFAVPAVDPQGHRRVRSLEKEIQSGYVIDNQAQQQKTQMDFEQKRGNDIVGAQTDILTADDKNTEIGFRLQFYVTRVILLERGRQITDLFCLEQINDAEAGDAQEQYLYRVFGRFNISPEMLRLIEASAHDPQFERRLTASVAPFVYSNDAVKIALILYLLGGVEKISADGARCRADINVLLVGDPSTAKSYLLRYIADLAERAVYTSGKSASAAGLTAAVALDQDTGEWGIEPGAMLRANGGICCIDEFDKISQQDISALHECMEQQQVSISKAGVSATMEAKTAVLAAMNPMFGRYNKMLSLKQNVNISSAILSRFDLVFIMCDQPSEDVDRAIAQKILGVMMGKEEAIETPLSREFLQNYIKAASCQLPVLTKEAQDSIKERWVEMRRDDLKVTRKNQRVTIRQLESLIRLSEAYAKLHMSRQVTEEHVASAYQLYQSSIVVLQQESYRYEIVRSDDGVEAAAVSDDAGQRSVTQNKQFNITLTEIDRLCVVAKFSMQRQGKAQVTLDELKSLVFENLSYQDATTEELRAISLAIIKSMVLEHQYLTKSGDQLDFKDDDSLEFTHLAPSL